MIEVCFLVYQRVDRVPIILEQLLAQTTQNFRVNIWNNSKEKLNVSSFPKERLMLINSPTNVGSQARFRLAKQTKGDPIIFLDDDENPSPDFVKYHYDQYMKFGRGCILGYFTRVFDGRYWAGLPSCYGQEVDYVATKSMVFCRKILDIEPLLQNIPEQFAKVEDLYLCYLARMKYNMRMIQIEAVSKGIVDGKDQYRTIDKEKIFKILRAKGWWIIKDGKRKIKLKNYSNEIWVDITIPNNDVLKRGLLADGHFYEEDLLECARKLPLVGNKIIVDVGANVGNHTIFFALFCLNKGVVSFEPYEKVRKVLTNHVKMNNLNVTIVPYAVADEEGFCDLEESPGNEAGIPWDGRTYVKEGSSIKMVTLDNYLDGKEISLIKLDIEGYEYKALLGAKRILEKQHPYLFVEAKTLEEKNRIETFLSPFGYQCVAMFNRPSPTYLYK